MFFSPPEILTATPRRDLRLGKNFDGDTKYAERVDEPSRSAGEHASSAFLSILNSLSSQSMS